MASPRRSSVSLLDGARQTSPAAIKRPASARLPSTAHPDRTEDQGINSRSPKRSRTSPPAIPPCYWPYDIVSYGLPVSSNDNEEQHFWDSRAAHHALTAFVTDWEWSSWTGSWTRAPAVLEVFRTIDWKAGAREKSLVMGRADCREISPTQSLEGEEGWRGVHQAARMLLDAVERG